jgi:hypothetical protein
MGLLLIIETMLISWLKRNPKRRERPPETVLTAANAVLFSRTLRKPSFKKKVNTNLPDLRESR